MKFDGQSGHEYKNEQLYEADWNDELVDVYPNSDVINIVYMSSTFGRFLKFVIDKFSKLTPEIPAENPFGGVGTSHKKIKYSNKILHHHMSFINVNKDKENLPVCLITANSNKSFLFLKTARRYRTGDHGKNPNNLKQHKDTFEDQINNIKKLYNIENFDHTPDFIIRDFYKLTFLASNKDFDRLQFAHAQNHKFFKKQNVFEFDLDSFFEANAFINTLKECDNFFNLQIDWTHELEIKNLFETGVKVDPVRQDTIKTMEVVDAIKNKQELEFSLPIIYEAFISAYVELNYKGITMPLVNNFYKNTKEIIDYIEYIPNWYKRKNPNI